MGTDANLASVSDSDLKQPVSLFPDEYPTKDEGYPEIIFLNVDALSELANVCGITDKNLQIIVAHLVKIIEGKGKKQRHKLHLKSGLTVGVNTQISVGKEVTFVLLGKVARWSILIEMVS